MTMTEREAIEKLKKIDENPNTERRHVDADELIVTFLKDQGYNELADVYEDITNDVWYS